MNLSGPCSGAFRPADICTFDFHGKVVEHDPLVDPYVNDTIALHAVIHRYNPQIAAVVHTHPPATVTYGTFPRVPEIYDQESCFLAGDIGIAEQNSHQLPPTQHRPPPFPSAATNFAA